MREKYARKTHDGRKQTVAEHINNVYRLMLQFDREGNFSNLLKLLAVLHDAGKLSDAFQEYILQERAGKRGAVIHSAQGARLILENYYDTEGSEARRFAALLIATVTASHHGRLPDMISPDNGRLLLLERLQNDTRTPDYKQVVSWFYDGIMSAAELEATFEAATEEIDAHFKKIRKAALDINFASGLLVKHFFSMLIDADRLDAYIFETGDLVNLISDESEDNALFSWRPLIERFEGYMERLSTEKVRDDALAEQSLEGHSRMNAINDARSAISEACKEFSNKERGIYRLNVPTGGGKTYSSMRFALHHALQSKMERIVYVIPYLSIIDQTASEFRKILGDEHLLEHHSNAIPDNPELDDAARDEILKEYDLLTERWDSRIIITTMVQFLESVYSGKTRKLRKIHHLANTVFVFDEVQALPLACTHLFNELMNYLNVVCCGTVVLCTATQPPLEAFYRSLNVSEESEMVSLPTEMLQVFERVKIYDARRSEKYIRKYTHSELATFIAEKSIEHSGSGGSSALVIVNTKRDALKLYLALLEENVELSDSQKYHIFHLSTNQCPAHRLSLIDGMKTLLKNRANRIICVSTQLIEAGVDISFSCVFRALAGLDSIAQAVGRCNRNGENEQGYVYLVQIKEEQLGKLKDIRTAQDSTIEVFESMGDILINDGNAMLSDMVVREYYKSYYRAIGAHGVDRFDFPTRRPGMNLYDLLSKNRFGQNMQNSRGLLDENLPFLQAFETAGKEFFVIDSADTTVVIVPYGEGKDIIAGLCAVNNSDNLRHKKELLRRSGSYSVTLWRYQFEILVSSGAISFVADNIPVLLEEYYEDGIGISFDDPRWDFLEA
jgi:CRISPR-associated endonuclease/helicase Cas3